MVNDGHEIGNHTYHHPNMKVLDLKKLEEEIYLLEFKFNEITNSKLSKYFRPPQGVYSLEQLDKISSLGYKTIFWSLAYMDYDKNNQPSYQTALNLLKSRTHNGAIILLHNTSKTNSEILDEYIRYHLNLGYEFSLLDF